jgi:ubiquitin carboxyl-terminal hydrolase MINDY-1/2
MAATAPAESSAYAIKRVEFFGRTAKICLQNRNGPCPLLALANVLSLRNELKLPAGSRSVSQGDLITVRMHARMHACTQTTGLIAGELLA